MPSHPREPDSDDIPSNPTGNAPIGCLIEARLTRRGLLRGLGAASLSLALPASLYAARRSSPGGPSSLTFVELDQTIDGNHHVAVGYRADVLLRWGDPVLPDAPPFEIGKQSVTGQLRQFGYNNDFIAYLPLPLGSASSDHGLLCVNHEYTDADLMWPADGGGLPMATRIEIEMAAHGHSVVEIRRRGGGWRALRGSPYNRRLTATTPMRIAGPAAGDARMKTSSDPSGCRVEGTINNCAGGVTPWGTVLIAEENLHKYFIGDAEKSPEAAALARYGFSATDVGFRWGDHVPRFDLERESNEPNRFGWMVELDPYDPFSVPVKRTALGRMKHEGAGVALNPDGRVVAYMGDDQAFEYVYKFVSHGRFDPDVRARNRDLLDNGTLFVARFAADGSGVWLPLVFGSGPLTPANGFRSQADVLIEARRAADLLGATPMDRPEDVELDPLTGRVYVMLTNNALRRPAQVDGANPRPVNRHGHVLELAPPGEAGATDHAALSFEWNVFLRAGDPGDEAQAAAYHAGTSKNGWFSAPDNCAFDRRGRLWIATDQGSAQAVNAIADGLRACDTVGDGRALTRLFFKVPVGAECCGPAFTPDGSTLFVAVQHPGEGSTFEKPSTRWPDFDADLPPRPAVVAITKEDGGEIGS